MGQEMGLSEIKGVAVWVMHGDFLYMCFGGGGGGGGGAGECSGAMRETFIFYSHYSLSSVTICHTGFVFQRNTLQDS